MTEQITVKFHSLLKTSYNSANQFTIYLTYGFVWHAIFEMMYKNKGIIVTKEHPRFISGYWLECRTWLESLLVMNELIRFVRHVTGNDKDFLR